MPDFIQPEQYQLRWTAPDSNADGLLSFTDAGIRAFLLHLRANEETPEHKVKGLITLHRLQGSVLFRTAAEAEESVTGSLLSRAGEVPHSLLARCASLLLATVWE